MTLQRPRLAMPWPGVSLESVCQLGDAIGGARTARLRKWRISSKWSMKVGTMSRTHLDTVTASTCILVLEIRYVCSFLVWLCVMCIWIRIFYSHHPSRVPIIGILPQDPTRRHSF